MKEVKIAIWGNGKLKDLVRDYLLWCGGIEFEKYSYTISEALYWIDPKSKIINYSIRPSKISGEREYYNLGYYDDEYKISIKNCQEIENIAETDIINNIVPRFKGGQDVILKRLGIKFKITGVKIKKPGEWGYLLSDCPDDIIWDEESLEPITEE